MATPTKNGRIRFLPLQYDSNESETSALGLLFSLRPDWQSIDSKVEFVRFTDGITNTLLKAINKKPGLSDDEIEREAILLRAYGHGTDVIIDRQQEARNHELLMQYGLAPELLARFKNGMMYRFTRGSVAQPEDLRRSDISNAIARRLAQWHAVVPCVPWQRHNGASEDGFRNGGAMQKEGNTFGRLENHSAQNREQIAPSGKPEPNFWTVMQKWILALPNETEADQQRRDILQKELKQLIKNLSQRPGLGHDGLVFAHNDLLSGNIIMLPKETNSESCSEVMFIDYEYGVPSPAAFDIANHFAEWGGFDCDASVLPTVCQRRRFVNEYIRTYASLCPSTGDVKNVFDIVSQADGLLREVDVFRGLPGFYWGIWALIQATISEIDFDYASYAETRLSEYWAWKAEVDGSREASGAEMPLREKRWGQEADEGEDT